MELKMNFVEAVKDAQKNLEAIDPKNSLLKMVLVGEGPMVIPDGSIFTPKGGGGLFFTSELVDRYTVDKKITPEEALDSYVYEVNRTAASYRALKNF